MRVMVHRWQMERSERDADIAGQKFSALYVNRGIIIDKISRRTLVTCCLRCSSCVRVCVCVCVCGEEVWVLLLWYNTPPFCCLRWSRCLRTFTRAAFCAPPCLTTTCCSPVETALYAYHTLLKHKYCWFQFNAECPTIQTFPASLIWEK